MSGIIQGLLSGLGGGTQALQFVGGAATTSIATQTPSYSLTSLSGGVASSPTGGDLVIAVVNAKTPPPAGDISCTTAGYTAVSTAKTCSVFYKVLSSAETSVAFDLGVSNTSSFAVHVWRNSNATPLDATSTIATGSEALPNPPAITTVTNNAVVIAIAGVRTDGSGSLFGTFSVPSGMSNFFSAGSGASPTGTPQAVMIASILRPTAGAYNPDPFGYSGITSDIIFRAVTMAVRPQ